ncbi:g7982 [Coccomyxa elongata]
MAYATIPAGHRSSDLRQEVCNIGLNRRRDLTLRGDIKVSTTEGPQRLSTLLKGHVSAIFGLPDLGSVCGNQVASFMESADALKAAGVKKILCVSVNKPSVVDRWLKERGAENIVQGVADDTGAFTRMLGVNVNDPERPQLRCQRFAAIVDDGILVKMRVEDSPGDLKASNADALLGLLEDMKTLKAA